MRIVHVMEAIGGGTALHLCALAGAQVAAGHEVAAAIPATRSWGMMDPSLGSALQEAGVDVLPLGLRRSPWHPANSLDVGRIGGAIRRLKPDIVHTHSTTAGFVARPVARALRVPVIHTPQGVPFADAASTWPARMARLGERLLAAATDRVVAASPSEAEVLETVYPPGRVAVVPNGIAVMRSPPPPFPPVPGVVAVNRLAYQKNPEAVVRIMAALRRLRPDSPAAIVGGGPLTPAVRSLVARVDPGIELAGERDGRAAIAAATVVLLASRWEGAPYVPLEAMDLGRPVVASAVVGTRDVVADGVTGYLFAAGHEARAARLVAELLDDPARAARLGAAGRERLVARFQIDDMVAGVERVYQSVLSPTYAASR